MKIYCAIVSIGNENLLDNVKQLMLSCSSEERIQLAIYVEGECYDEVKHEYPKAIIMRTEVEDRKETAHRFALLQQSINMSEVTHYMQLHMQNNERTYFVKHWDLILEHMIAQAQMFNNQVVLTTSGIPSQIEENGPITLNDCPHMLCMEEYGEYSLKVFDEYHMRRTPIVSYIVDYGMLIAPVKWCLEVPCDPNLRMSDLTTNLSIRSFCSRWDIYSSYSKIFYKEYKESIYEESEIYTTMREVIEEESIGQYSLKLERTIEEYGEQSGIDHKNAVIVPIVYMDKWDAIYNDVDEVLEARYEEKKTILKVERPLRKHKSEMDLKIKDQNDKAVILILSYGERKEYLVNHHTYAKHHNYDYGEIKGKLEYEKLLELFEKYDVLVIIKHNVFITNYRGTINNLLKARGLTLLNASYSCPVSEMQIINRIHLTRNVMDVSLVTTKKYYIPGTICMYIECEEELEYWKSRFKLKLR